MPPNDPGSFSDSYLELVNCYLNGPENTENCDWIIPPGGDCQSEVLSIDISTILNSFILHQNHPNPFNPVTSINFTLPKMGLVNIMIYDMKGRMVKRLLNASREAGYNSIQWNAMNDQNEQVSAGLYLYTIQVGVFRQTKKIVLLK